ncbi:hypothetical protein OSTOST_10111, partial [Ostertagia ostertagi]
MEEFESTGDKRALSSSTLWVALALVNVLISAQSISLAAGTRNNMQDKQSQPLKKHFSASVSGLGKRAVSSFDTLGGIGLGKRQTDKKALSSFDTLGGIGLGKRYDVMTGEKKSVSSFDTLAGIGLGKRAGYFTP